MNFASIRILRFACAVICAFIVAGSLAGCAKSDATDPASADQSKLARVHAVAATLGPAAPVIQSTGLLVNKDEIRLSFKVGGVVNKIAVQEGQHVTRGQVLAEIEQEEINAQVEQAKQAAEKAARDLARAEKLFADRLISQGQLDDLHTQAAVSKAALQSAQFNKSYATIVAPQGGTILRKLVQERELVAAGAPVLVLGSQERGYVVRVGLADREIVQVRIGDAATVELDAYPSVKFPARITEVASGADERTGTFQVELRLQPTKLRLVSGLVAKVSITPATAQAGERVYVPIASIVEGDGRRASVFVLAKRNGAVVAERRHVDVAFIAGDRVALTKGVAAGEKIITDGALYLQDGEHVKDAG